MGPFVIRRLLIGMLIIILVSIIVFLLVRVLGDPLLLYLSKNEITNISPVDLAALKHSMGLDQSLPLQYLNWFRGILHGDFGKSIFIEQPVLQLIKQSLPITINVGILAFFATCIIGPLLGTICAVRRGTWIDSVLSALANLGMTIPAFWLGILLIYLFAFKLDWLPITGYTSPFENPLMNVKQLILPVICLSLGGIANLTRQTRANVIEVVYQDYIRTAWAKGLCERKIIMRHMIKNAFIPIVTIMGLYVSTIFGGSVLIETIFNIPGMGRLMTTALTSQDYQVVQACILLTSIIVVGVNILVDIIYGYLDPRIRFR